MSLTYLLLAVALLCAVSFYFGRQRAVALSKGRYSNLHSLPAHYGMYTALWCGLPALGLLLVWMMSEGTIIQTMIVADLPEEVTSNSGLLSLALNSISQIAAGGGEHLTVSPEIGSVLPPDFFGNARAKQCRTAVSLYHDRVFGDCHPVDGRHCFLAFV
jgi:phosphate transport system permease protein